MNTTFKCLIRDYHFGCWGIFFAGVSVFAKAIAHTTKKGFGGSNQYPIDHGDSPKLIVLKAEKTSHL